MRLFSFVATMALLAPAAVADGARESGAPMRHADSQYLPNATGNVSIRDGADFQRFTVQVFPAADHVMLTAQINDEGDHFADLGALTWSSAGAGMTYNVTTQGDAHLPLGVAHAGDLSGRHVRVLDGEGHVILVGEVPALGDVVPTPDPRPEPTPQPTGDIWARAVMVRPEQSPYDDSRGVIAVVHRADSEAFRVEVGHLAPQTRYVVYLGDDAGGTAIADFTTNGEGGASIADDTANGGELPGGATLADLAGRHVEVRHGEDVVLLGAVPHVEDHQAVEHVHEDATHHDESSGADLHVVVDIKPHEGHEGCRIEATHLPTHENHDSTAHDGTAAGGDAPKSARKRPTADVYMDDGSGNLVLIGSSRIDRRGRARLVFTTRGRGSLPLGAATLRELAGRNVEVRVNGAALVSGPLPTL